MAMAATLTSSIIVSRSSSTLLIKQFFKPSFLSSSSYSTSLKTLKPASSLNLAPPLGSSIAPITSDLPPTPTSPKSLKSCLRNGETLYGLFLLTLSPTLAEIAGLAGYDFVVVDIEHGHGGTSEALPCLYAAGCDSIPAVAGSPEQGDEIGGGLVGENEGKEWWWLW